MNAENSVHGILDSVRLLIDRLIGGAQERVELVSLELQEEKARLIQTLIWLGAASFAVAATLIFGSITLVFLLWDNARLAALGGLTLAYATGAAASIVAFRRYLARQPRPFAASIDELKEDRACTQPRS
jgi:uncharacterized membrane protein YqjE